MFLSKLVIVATLSMALMGVASADIRGFATYNASTDFTPNSCQITDVQDNMVGAVSEDLWQGGAVCGKCIEVWGTQNRALPKKIKLTVVDFCSAPDCQSSGSLSLTADVFAALDGTSKSNKKISWDWVSCSTTDGSGIASSTGRSSKSNRKIMATSN